MSPIARRLPLRRLATLATHRQSFSSLRLALNHAGRHFCQRSDASSKKAAEVPIPTNTQLRHVFTQSAVPFVAFGIVDQTVLIYMGDVIDNSLGVWFSFPTLAAAAMGQVFSDSCGVAFGGTIEAAAMKLGLPLPGITEDQYKLGIVRRISTFGGVLGVIVGCFIGMLNLLCIDLESADRAKRAQQLEGIMKTIMEDGRDASSCERATLWAIDEKAHELWSSVAQGVDGILRVPMSGESIAALVARSRKIENIPDVTKDPRYKSRQVGDFVTRNMLVVPVILDDKCVAVIQLLNKMCDENPSGSSPQGFNREDERIATMLAKHVAIFMSQLG